MKLRKKVMSLPCFRRTGLMGVSASDLKKKIETENFNSSDWYFVGDLLINELKHILSLTEPAVVFCTKKTRPNITKIIDDLDFMKTFICFDSSLEVPSKNDFFKTEDGIDMDQVAVICNSSGTTGLPKAVMLTHKNLRLNFSYTSDPEIFSEGVGKMVPVVLPFFHSAAIHLTNGALCAKFTIIPFDGFDPNLFLESVQKYKVENLVVVPTLINFLANSPIMDKYDLSSIKRVYSTGALVSDEDLQSLWSRLNLREFKSFYGLTEVGVAVQSSRHSHGNKGSVTPGRHLKMVDLENGQTLPPNRSGEICIKGEIMKGYVKNLEETQKIIDSQGFLYSGDIGYFDQDGCVYVTGRIKEIIKYKSFQVSPIELEMILIKHESIEDVAVVGKPDRRFGKVPVAFVVKKEGATVTEKEIYNYLAEFVSEEKRLHGGVRFVQNIPRNSMGKIMRYELVKQLNV